MKKAGVIQIFLIFIVFLASGIWHGAGWNFVIWGMLHGVCILIHRIWKNTGRKLPKLIGWFITINLVNIFWVFFRAKDLQSATKVLKGMIDIPNLIYMMTHLGKIKEMTLEFRTFAGGNMGTISNILILVVSILIVFFFKNSFEDNKNIFSQYIEWKIAFLFSLSILFFNNINVFLYFNF